MTNIILKLFTTFFKIGAFSIGGGYAIIPLIEDQVVNSEACLSLREYTDIITISQMTPGPLGVNTASFVGIRIAGTLGAIVASLGSVLSGFILSIFLYRFFKKNQEIESVSYVLKGLRASSVGLIASAAGTIILIAFFGSQNLSLDMANINIAAIIIFFISLFVLRKYKLNPILIMIITGILGLVIY